MTRLLLLSCLLLQGCVTYVATQMGAGIQTLSMAQTVDTAKTAADVVSYGATQKTLTDHAVGTVIGKDCKLTNIMDQTQKVCRDKN